MGENDRIALESLASEFASLRRELSDEHRQALQIAVLTEELRTRWQQLIQWDESVDKWMASYAIALVVGVSWILGTERVGDLAQFFQQRNSNNGYFILALAVVNAVYLLSIAFKGYQHNQLRIYIFTNITGPLNEISNLEANQWEKLHRRKGKPEWRRLFYYPIMTTAPFGVSVVVLIMYYLYVGSKHGWFNPHNLAFYFAVLLNIAALVLSLSSTKLNKKWKEVIDAQGQRKARRNEATGERTLFETGTQANELTPSHASDEARHKSDIRTDEPDNVSQHRDSFGASVMGVTLLAGCLILALKEKFKKRD